MLRGWIKIDRDIIKRSIFGDAELLRLYIYLKIDTYHKPVIKNIDGKSVTIKPGQGTFGVRQLSGFLDTSISTTHRRLKKLETMGLISLEAYKEMTVYTINDYEIEQEWNADGTPVIEKRNANGTPLALQGQGVGDDVILKAERKRNEDGTKPELLKEREEERRSIIPPTPYDEILKLYHLICVSLPKVRQLTDNRKRTLGARWGEHKDLEIFKELFTKAEQSDFLSGRKQTDKDWKCNFDWLINQQNMIKILEGNYDGKSQQKVFKKPKLVVR